MVGQSVRVPDIASLTTGSRSGGGWGRDWSRHHRRGYRLNRLSTLGRRVDRWLRSLGMRGYRKRHNRQRSRGRLIDWGLSDLRWLRRLRSAKPVLVRLDKLNILFLNGFRVAKFEAVAMNRQEFIVDD